MRKKKKIPNDFRKDEQEILEKKILACDRAYTKLLELQRKFKLIGFRTPHDNR